MLEKGTLVIVEWLSYDFLLFTVMGNTVYGSDEKKLKYAAGWVLEDSKDILIIQALEGNNENVQFHINKDDIVNITVLADAKECPF